MQAALIRSAAGGRGARQLRILRVWRGCHRFWFSPEKTLAQGHGNFVFYESGEAWRGESLLFGFEKAGSQPGRGGWVLGAGCWGWGGVPAEELGRRTKIALHLDESSTEIDRVRNSDTASPVEARR